MKNLTVSDKLNEIKFSTKTSQKINDVVVLLNALKYEGFSVGVDEKIDSLIESLEAEQNELDKQCKKLSLEIINQ